MTTKIRSEVLDEFYGALEDGLNPSVDEYMSRYPQFGPSFRRLLAELTQVHMHELEIQARFEASLPQLCKSMEQARNQALAGRGKVVALRRRDEPP